MLKGERLVLRPLRIEDMDVFSAWRNNLQLIKMTQGIRYPKSKEMEHDWYYELARDKSNRRVMFGVETIREQEFIGVIQLYDIDYISGTCKWCFIIGDERNQGKGYGTEAPHILFDYAFNVLNLRKISTFSIAINQATARMKDKLGGFKQEGLMKDHVYFDGKYHDVVIMALFRDDYYKSLG